MPKKNIIFQCEPEYKDMVHQKAKEQQMSVAAFIRIAIAEKIRNDKREMLNDN